MSFSAHSRPLALCGLVLALCGLVLAPGLAQPASAQTLEEEMAQEEGTGGGTGDATGDAATGGSTDGSGGGSAGAAATDSHLVTDEQAVYEERTATTTSSDTDPRERADTDYFFLGAFARGVIVPTFVQELFVDYSGGQGASGDPVNAGVGGFFTWRRNGFGVTAEVWYLGFQTRGYYHGLGAADSEFEYIESSLGAVFGNFLFSWGIDVTEWFAFDIGFGLGFGGMVGDLYRTEAYRASGTQDLQPCTGPGMPAAAGCEGPLELRGTGGRLDDTRTRGGTYQRFRTGDPTVDGRNGPNPWYFGDGGVPPMFFWLDLPRIGLRFKPIRQIQIRVDGGYNLYGFNFGGSIAYGF